MEEIYTPNVLSVAPATPTSEALAIMRDRKISCIVVVDEKQPVGIFTERDVIRCVATQGLGFAANPIADVMTPNVRTVELDSTLFDAFAILAEHRIRHLVVVDGDNKAIGVTTQSDMIDHFGYDFFVKVRVVSQVMNKCAASTPATSTVYDAARDMADQDLSFFVIVDNFIPIGVLTERDVARLIADGVDIKKALVEDHMTSPVITINRNQPAFDAAELLRTNEIRRLIVVDDDDRICGVITQTDLVRGLESKYIETLKQIIKEQGAELDNTIHKLAQKTLYLDTILNSSINMGIAATDKDLTISYFNQSAEKIFGVPARFALGRSLNDIHKVEGVSLERVDKALDMVRNKKRYSFSMERPLNGSRIYIRARLSGIFDDEDLIGYLLMFEDVTRQRKADETIRRLAYYDILTELPNRALFYERLKADVARAKRRSEEFSVMLMDVDEFKQVNDIHGHHTGDVLLATIAERLRGVLRDSDTVARLGGDEFCFIFAESMSHDDLLIVVKKILDRLSPQYDLEGIKMDVRFSMGVAMFPMHGQDPDILLHQADQAMYEAKERGRKNQESNICVLAEDGDSTICQA